MHILQQKIYDLAKGKNIQKMSLRQIGKFVDESHPQNVKFHLEQLVKRGLVKKHRNGKYSLINNNDSGSILSIPILGEANCGEALLSAEEDLLGFLKLSKSLFPASSSKHHFALRAVGDSMNDANIDGSSIEEGDYVVVDSRQASPNNGDYVVSTIDGAANIKRFIHDEENEQVVLISESKSPHDYPPIYIHQEDSDSYIVNGVIKSVVKTPKI